MAKAAVKPITPHLKQPAEPPAQAPAKAEAKPKKKRRGKLLWLGVLLLGVAAASTVVVMVDDPQEKPRAEQPKPEKPPAFLNLETFTVNLQQEVGDQYLQVSLTVKATDDAAVDAMKQRMPEIRNHLLLLLSSKRSSELLTVQGKVQLADEILREVKKPIPEPLRPHLAAVYFTSFVIQ
jgi:flagellar FliL protein